MTKHATLYLLGIALSLTLLLAACGPATPAADSSPEQAESQTETLPTAEAVEAAAEEVAPPATSTPPPAPAQDDSYPPPPVVEQPAYPAEGEAALPEPTPLPDNYPAPTVEEFREPRFRIDGPLAVGAVMVEGQAPPDVAIAVLDVTYNGQVLGTGRSDADGRFAINVSPLVAGNRVGITVGELEPGQTINEMAETYFPYRGEGFMNLPNVGILFDTLLVQQ